MSLKQRLNLTTPIIQAPMAGASNASFVACASNLGVLGSLGAGMMSCDKIHSEINTIKSLTDKPFAVNLMILPKEKTQKYSSPMPTWLKNVYDELGVMPVLDDYPAYDFAKQFDVLLQNPVPVASFTFGILDKSQVLKLHDVGTLVIGTANLPEEAKQWQDIGADAVILQSGDAGGHQGGFLDEDAEKLSALTLLKLTQKQVSIPLIAAGGIDSKVKIDELLQHGADMVAIGTLFLTTKESPIHALYKQRLLKAKPNDTVMTKAFSGKWARGIKNNYIQRTSQVSAKDLPEYPSLNAMTKPLRAHGAKTDNPDLLSLWAGMSVGGCRDETIAQLVKRLVLPTLD